MAKKKIKDGDIIITCDKKPACYEHIARLEVLRKYRKLDKEHETAVTQYNAVVNQNKDLQTELNHYKKAHNKKIGLILTKCAHILTFNDTAIIKPMVFDIQEIAKELKGG